MFLNTAILAEIQVPVGDAIPPAPAVPASISQHPQLLLYFDRKGDMVEVPHFLKLGVSGEISLVIPFW